MEFSEKVIWITGASSGIGRALAEEAARRGARLVLAGRNLAALEEVRQICRDLGADVRVVPLDLSDSAAFDGLAGQVAAEMGRIDILVNNGGISQRARAKDTSMEVVRRIMEVNFFGAVALTRAVLPYMLAQKGGHIVVVSSVVGKFGFPLRSAYSASKHALHGYFESLQTEHLEDNIHVTMVVPGRIRTSVSVHAVTADGTAYGKMDEGQAKGIPPSVCAKKIISGVQAGRREILVGGNELWLLRIKRFLPGMFYKIVKRIKPT